MSDANRPTEGRICYCGSYGGGVHTKSARCDGSKEPSPPPGARECICPDCEKVWQEHMQKEFGHAPEPSVEQKIKARDFHYALIEQHGLKDDAVTNSIVRKGLERLAGIAPEPGGKFTEGDRVQIAGGEGRVYTVKGPAARPVVYLLVDDIGLAHTARESALIPAPPETKEEKP